MAESRSNSVNFDKSNFSVYWSKDSCGLIIGNNQGQNINVFLPIECSIENSPNSEENSSSFSLNPKWIGQRALNVFRMLPVNASPMGIWSGCFWLYADVFWIKGMWIYINPYWLIAVQVLVSLGLILPCVTVICVILYFILVGNPIVESTIALVCQMNNDYRLSWIEN